VLGGTIHVVLFFVVMTSGNISHTSSITFGFGGQLTQEYEMTIQSNHNVSMNITIDNQIPAHTVKTNYIMKTLQSFPS
jgi:hypothetical protein